MLEMTSRAEKLVMYSFTRAEMARLNLRQDFRTAMHNMTNMDQAENLVQSGHYILEEMDGLLPMLNDARQQHCSALM